MKCPNCGKDNPPGSKFCNECGKKLPEQSLEQIWAEVQESSKKPTSILKDVSESGTAEIRKPESKFKSLLKRKETLVCGIIGGAIVLVAVLGICLSTCNCNSTPTQAVNTSETDTSEPATSEEAKSAYQIHYADLDKTVQFNDIELDVNSNWEYKKMYNNKVVYYINGKSYCLTLFRREISLDDATNFVNATLENKDNKYLSCRKDYVNDVSGVAYSEIDRNDNYIRTSAFYYDKYLYSISLTAAKEYEDDVMKSFPVIRATIDFDKSKIETTPETEPATEKPTPKPTEPPTEAPTSITDTLPLIFSNDEFDVYFVSAKPYEYDDTETLVKFLINNKYNTQIEFQADTIILDGISYSDIIMSDPVSANSLGYIEATVEDCSNSNPSSVGGDLKFFDKIGDGATRGDINIPSTSIK